MTSYNLNDRWQENRNVWKDYFEKFTTDSFSKILVTIAILLVFFGYLNQHGTTINLSNIFSDFYANVSSELLSIVLTVVILERLNAKRQDKQELTRLKALLGSNETVVTKIAIAELKARGWLEDGSLKESNLASANLENTNLIRANLEKATLEGVNLKNSYLFYANLKQVDLEIADMRGTFLEGADLRNSYLMEAKLHNSYLGIVNLRGADLTEAELQGAKLDYAYLPECMLGDTILYGASLTHADLYGAQIMSADMVDAGLRYANLQMASIWDTDLDLANLAGANLRGVTFEYMNLDNIHWQDDDVNVPTILPDGTTWSKDEDMTRFTNSEHPDFKATLKKIEEIRLELNKPYDEANEGWIARNEESITEHSRKLASTLFYNVVKDIDEESL